MPKRDAYAVATSGEKQSQDLFPENGVKSPRERRPQHQQVPGIEGEGAHHRDRSARDHDSDAEKRQEESSRLDGTDALLEPQGREDGGEHGVERDDERAVRGAGPGKPGKEHEIVEEHAGEAEGKQPRPLGPAFRDGEPFAAPSSAPGDERPQDKRRDGEPEERHEEGGRLADRPLSRRRTSLPRRTWSSRALCKQTSSVA